MSQSDFDLEFFRDHGFRRKVCPKCQRAFWSLGDWESCGEPPCDEYAFIGNSPMKEPLGLHETREAYLSFFEANGHTRIGRYPIVARWRNDVFFTQASIYDFQPYVLNGTIEPPANPLTISQTCVRFNDIENVGKTGRHFTFFEMMAHHVFNRIDREEIYFKSHTVELCHRFFTERMGTDPEKMRYIEEWWEGGGNSGPCLEVILDGVEVATLVFMMFRETPRGRVPLDMRVVDTGYGLERICWVSQGSSSAYEAVFGPVVEGLKEQVGVSSDNDIMKEYAKIAGMTNARTSSEIMAIREMTASRLGISYEELMRTVGPLEDIYVICDHSRALAIMINDAVVPSNTREGYFARLLIRRALRSIRNLQLDLRLDEIVAKQIDFFQGTFPEMASNREDILNIIRVEEDRYHDTLERGRQLVAKMAKGMKPGEIIGKEMLIELYDSHGLNPEIVAEFSEVPVEIPDDFYLQVAKQHETPDENTKEETTDESGLPETVPLYYEDVHLQHFQAQVVAIKDDGLILDRTAFYPEGGGQEWDLGTINGLAVTQVLKMGKAVWHQVPGLDAKVGDRVQGEVDMERRRQLMSHHTAAHIINGVCRRMFGNHIWQAGANKSLHEARLDITHYENFSPSQIVEIERECNRLVMQDIATNISFCERDEAEARHGFRLYQGGVVPGKTIRVVDVPGVDAEACGGLHVRSTGEIGPIRINRSKRIQDGVVRIEYQSGMAAVQAMIEDKLAVNHVAEELNVSRDQAEAAVSKLRAEHREAVKALDSLNREMAQNAGVDLMKTAPQVQGVKVICYMAQEGEDATELSKTFSAGQGVVSVVSAHGPKPRILVARSPDVDLDCRELLKDVMSIVGGGGGGKPDFAQGGGGDPAKVAEALEKVPKMLASRLA
jgi:alanyl-tRNA synthetase